jgi:uncharacterized membrane protein YdjX (TVP38/TMEM64 family)
VDRGKRNFIIFILIFVIATAVLSFVFWPFIRELRDPVYREGFSLWVEGLGWKGPLLLLGLQVLQVVVAVIPGEPVELLAGAAFGALGGLGLCLAGSSGASVLIFLVVKKFGAPFVEKFFHPRETGRFAFLRNAHKTSLVVFILFLIPGTPKDTLTYLAPLGRISLIRFILISTAARIPSVLSSTILGDSALRGDWTLFLLIFGCTALLGFAGIFFSDRIVNKLRGGASGELIDDDKR